MSDEIKENVEPTLEYLKICVEDDISFNTSNCKALLDYITNLQQENENLKDFNNKLQATKDRLDKYDKENTMLIEDYKSRVEKAVEYIKTKKAIINTDCIRIFDLFEIDEQSYIDILLNILQGGKDE